MKHEHLVYDGKLLHWREPEDGGKEASYKATSGLVGFQTTDRQCEVEKGPVPAGKHETFQNWGNNRVRFRPADQATKAVCPEPRGGFYLHDSTKGYSHGCIETENAFFNRLYMYTLVAKPEFMELRVQYAHADTNGGTKR